MSISPQRVLGLELAIVGRSSSIHPIHIHTYIYTYTSNNILVDSCQCVCQCGGACEVGHWIALGV